MSLDARRKLALFLSFVLLLAAAVTLLPDGLSLGDPACHSCHVAQMPVDHLLFSPNYLGYNSLCSFAPGSVSDLYVLVASQEAG